ncbi:MAG TPA: ATP-binding protein [Pseudomonas sp.]|nr:ATP-binding protein [Pseudomonas sp.]
MNSNRPRWRNLGVLALLLTLLLWPLHELAERYYSARLAEQNRQTLDLYVGNLLGTLRSYETLPGILGNLPVLRNALLSPDNLASLELANHQLMRLREQTGADVIYLMRADGLTIASSNWDQPDAFVNRNFAFRPYFQDAMDGQLGRFFGLGNTSGKRGYYFGQAIEHGRERIGVLVVKLDLDQTETLWGNSPARLVVTDSQGVVILTSYPGWRFHTTRPLSADERNLIAQHQPYPTLELPALRLDRNLWLRQSRELEEIGWTVSIMTPTSQLERPVQSVLAGGVIALLAILALYGLWLQRQRHYLDRLALSTQAQRELEERVLERTRDLETLNSRLKQEVLEREQAQQELVRAQDELVQSSKLSALGTMSASISHELNQPLAAIRSYADNARILLEHQRHDEVNTNLQQISALTTRAASIIAHLRAFARRDRHAPESMALQPALEDALALHTQRRRTLEVELIRDLPDAPLWVQGGETRLRQVLNNLIANSLDALSVRPPPRRLWIAARQDEHGVSLSIRDNGPGFSEHALAHALEPFFTTKTSTQGLGLGLAICDSLIRALGGELLIQNHAEGGAQLILRLRLAEPGTNPYPPEDLSA